MKLYWTWILLTLVMSSIASAITGTSGDTRFLLVGSTGHIGANITSLTTAVGNTKKVGNRLQGAYNIGGVYTNITSALAADQPMSGRFNLLNIDVFNPVISDIRAEDITVFTGTIKWTTDEDADSIVNYGTSQNLLLSTASTSARETGHAVTLTGLAEATIYFYNVTSCDRFGFCKYVGTSSFSTLGNAPVGSGSVSFGGGGISRTTQGYSLSKHFASIPPNKIIQIPIVSEFIAFSKIVFKLKEQVDKIEIKITRNPTIKDAPALKNAVYQYIKVDHDKITDNIVDFTTISFSVTNDWLTTQKIRKENIALVRLVDRVWTEVPTKLVSESGLSVSYESTFKGLSYYAIIGKETKEEKVEAKEETKEEISEEKKEEKVEEKKKETTGTAGTKEEATPPELETETNLWIGVVIFIVLLVIGYLIYRKMEQ